MVEECAPVALPQMGEGVHEASVVRWLKKPGDRITKGEPLVEVSTDKVDTEILAPASGFLIAIHSQAGEVVSVDGVMGYLGARADQIPPAAAATQTRPSKSAAAASRAPGGETTPRLEAHRTLGNVRGQPPAPYAALTPGQFAGAVRSSPLVRKLAEAHGVNLREVPGSGLYGRITKDDLAAYIQTGGRRVPRSAGSLEHDMAGSHRLATQVGDGREWLDGVPFRRESMTKIRRLTAEHMLRSVRVSPHVTTTFEMDLQRVETAKRTASDRLAKEHGVKLTYTTFFIASAVRALREFPELNASVDGHDILYREEINLGCAVAIGTGLIVPVIRDAGHKSFIELAASLQDLASRARDKKLLPQDVQGGTFSITNPGMFGSLHSQPIINQPQVAILSIGAIIKRPTVVGEVIAIHPLCQVGLTFDHRLVDGEGGAKFLAFLKQDLESFDISRLDT